MQTKKRIRKTAPVGEVQMSAVKGPLGGEEAFFVELPKRVYSLEQRPKQEATMQVPTDVSQHVREHALGFLGERLSQIIITYHRKSPEGVSECYDRCRWFYHILTDGEAVAGYRKHAMQRLSRQVSLFQYGAAAVQVMTPERFKQSWDDELFPIHSPHVFELYRKVPCAAPQEQPTRVIGRRALAKQLNMTNKVVSIDWEHGGMRELESVITTLKLEELKQKRGSHP